MVSAKCLCQMLISCHTRNSPNTVKSTCIVFPLIFHFWPPWITPSVLPVCLRICEAVQPVQKFHATMSTFPACRALGQFAICSCNFHDCEHQTKVCFCGYQHQSYYLQGLNLSCLLGLVRASPPCPWWNYQQPEAVHGKPKNQSCKWGQNLELSHVNTNFQSSFINRVDIEIK